MNAPQSMRVQRCTFRRERRGEVQRFRHSSPRRDAAAGLGAAGGTSGFEGRDDSDACTRTYVHRKHPVCTGTRKSRRNGETEVAPPSVSLESTEFAHCIQKSGGTFRIPATRGNSSHSRDSGEGGARVEKRTSDREEIASGTLRRTERGDIEGKGGNGGGGEGLAESV